MTTDNTIIRVPTPRFGINEVVYYRESAMLGYLEALRVQGVQYDSVVDRTFYYFTFKKTKLNNQTVGDANDLRNDNTIKIIEEELLTFCEALDVKIAWLQRELSASLILKCRCSFPVINSISPESGFFSGNNSVTIFGTGFLGSTVTVDSQSVELSAVTDTAIVFVMPPRAIGTDNVDVVVTVKVIAPGGNATTTYTYVGDVT